MSAHNTRKQLVKHKTIISDSIPASSINDTNNCVVLSTSIAFGIPYKDAYNLAKESGRPHGEGWYMSKIITLASKKGFHAIKLPPLKKTIYSLLKHNPTGRYIIVTHNHAFALVKGIIYDMGYNSPLTRIKAIYEVKSKRKELIQQSQTW